MRTLTGPAATVAFALLYAAPGALRSQQPAAPQLARSSQRCAADPASGWYRRQLTWLNDSRRDWSNDSLRLTLIAAMGSDTAGLRAPQLGASLTAAAAAGTIDTTVLLKLRDLARHREQPWPTRSVVGVAGARAALRIAALDSALERTALHRMMEAGPGEALPADVAVLEDGLRVRAGRGQLYGTQLREVTIDGVATLVPMRIEDSSHVDMRRASASLPPLAVGICLAKAARR